MVGRAQLFGPKTRALPHQAEAIAYVRSHVNAALFDEQGLGKTKIVIDALADAMKAGEIEGALVVAPMSLIYNWEREVEKHSFLLPVVLRGTRREKRYKFLTGANFYITNYEAVIAELQRMMRFCKSRKVAVVLDEAARIKDPTTKTAEALFALRLHSVRRIILTGTPVANRPTDVWSQFYFLDGGKLLGDDFHQFEELFSLRRSDYQARLDDLSAIVGSNSLRRCKGDVLQLPEKKLVNIYVEMAGKQRALYDELRSRLVVEVRDADGQQMLDESQNILKKLLRLTQIASNPRLIDTSYEETPAKFLKVDELLAAIFAREEKAILWTSFVENIQILRARYSEFKPAVIYGDVSARDRMEVVSSFQDDPEVRLLIANPAAAREGLTLTAANNAMYLDRSFSLTDYLQSQDRIHRISQDRPCTIYKLIASGTIDEYIDRIVEAKSDVAAVVQGESTGITQRTVDALFNRRELLRMLGG